MKAIETARLEIRRFDIQDAPFILRLVNEPAWLEHIGDKGVASVESAEKYLKNGPLAMYEQHGFGLNMVVLKESRAPVGMCGLLKRDSLADVDIGFAFLENYWGRGLARESVIAMLRHARECFQFERVVAITSPMNVRSESLLGRVGFRFDRKIRLEADSDLLNLWLCDFSFDEKE